MENAYWEGYCQGYDDEQANCPYDEGTLEWDSWYDGYEDGCRNG